MKKLLLSTILVVMLTASASYSPAHASALDRAYPDAASAAEEQFQQTYLAAIQRLIFPMLENEVQMKYGAYARLEYSDTEILSFDNIGSGDYLLKVRIRPFTGPHNSISEVDVSILCSPREIKINKFDIIKIYDDDIQLLD